MPSRGDEIQDTLLSIAVKSAADKARCRWCFLEGKPEWSMDAQCWIHRRTSVDKRCLTQDLCDVLIGRPAALAGQAERAKGDK